MRIPPNSKFQLFKCHFLVKPGYRLFLSSDKRDPCRAINTWSTTFYSLARKKNLWNFTRHEKDFFPQSHEIFRSIWSQVKLSTTSKSSLSLKKNPSICFYVYLAVNWVWQSIRADNESRPGFVDCTCNNLVKRANNLKGTLPTGEDVFWFQISPS